MNIISNELLIVNGLSKVAGKKTILEKVSFSVQRGEIFGLIGPNGSGKTTLIRMIMGLIKKDSGSVFMNNINITKDTQRVLDDIGVIIESPSMYKFMSGYKNLIHFKRMSKKDITMKQVDEAIRMVGLEEAIHKKVKNYSLGMRQRLGIAQAIMHNPSLLILDEPTNGLDPQGIIDFRNYLKLLKAEGKSIIVSSHLLSEMQLICDRAAILENGKLSAIIALNDDVILHQKEIEVDNVNASVTILRETGFQVDCNDEDFIRVSTPKEDIPNIVSILTSNGVKIYGIRDLEVQLEKEYFKLTKAEGL
ncbi:ABC transporter ATP-binding protein [Metabacillus sp. SLBN-84]